MKKLLIVDDDERIRKLLLTYAQIEGFSCVEAADGQDALNHMEGATFDLVILDVMMPLMDGFSTLKALREKWQTPVIMLTARNEEYDKLLGFELGVDDYVSKPFSPKELMARIGAVLKRTQKVDECLSYDQLKIFISQRKVMIGDSEVFLTPKEFDLLSCLCQNERLVLSRSQLLNQVWGYDYYGDARTVDTHIKSLREHLKAYRKLIQTVWGVGYKFEYEKK